jgi:hypothetical protein
MMAVLKRFVIFDISGFRVVYLKTIIHTQLGVVIHITNPSYLGDREEDQL